MKLREFWSSSPESLSLLNYFFFKILCFFEQVYSYGFSLIKTINLRCFYPKSLPFKVISVGNISTGGVGKSVLTRFLIENIPSKGAIILRGYKGENEKKPTSLLVSDGYKLYSCPSESGDEAYMFAHKLSIPVVVGKNRFKSGILLSRACPNVKYVILDDAYQNHKLKKDLEILLLDSRKPFGNGHCLPAGELREKDLSRADIIVLTHANSINKAKLDKIKKKLPKIPVVCGFHKVNGVFDSENKRVNSFVTRDKKFLAFAGIGSFSGFSKSLKTSGISIVDIIDYKDHHTYSKDDLKEISKRVKNNCHGAITTLKDWHKVADVIKKTSSNIKFQMYYLDINFEFLNKEERDLFLNMIYKVI